MTFRINDAGQVVGYSWTGYEVTREMAGVKSIYDLIDLRGILLGCNRRYLEFLSAIAGHR